MTQLQQLRRAIDQLGDLEVKTQLAKVRFATNALKEIEAEVVTDLIACPACGKLQGRWCKPGEPGFAHPERLQAAK